MTFRPHLLLSLVLGLCLIASGRADEHAPFDLQALAMLEQVRELVEDGASSEAARLYSEAAQIEPRIVTCMLPVDLTEPATFLRLYDMEAHPEAYAEGPVPRTLDDLQAVLEQDGRNPQALRERGLLFAAVGDWRQAQDDFELALTSDPEPWHVQVLLARIWLGWGDILSRMFYAAAMADEPPPDVPDWWRNAVLERPRELINSAISDGATGPVVEATRGQVLLDDYYSEHDPGLASEAADAFQRAAALLPAEPPPNLVKLNLELLVFSELSSARFVMADAEGYIDPARFGDDGGLRPFPTDVDTSAVDALCGER